MRPHYTPKLNKRTALLRELKQVFRRHRSQPIERVISLINPMLRGWVNYLAVGHSSECFGHIKDWGEKKVRRRQSPQYDRSHNPWHEANGGAQCGKSARCVRRVGGWRRGMVEILRPTGAPVFDPTWESAGLRCPAPLTFIKAYGAVIEARRSIGKWFEFYNDERPHQAL